MNRSEQVFFYHSFTNNDGILKVVTFPWHESHFQIFTQSQLTILCGISLCQEITFLYFLSFLHCRLQVNTSFLVCFNKLGEPVYSQIIFKAYQFFLLITIITHMNLLCINKFYHTITFRVNLNSCISCCLAFQACTNNWYIRADKRNSLSLHV